MEAIYAKEKEVAQAEANKPVPVWRTVLSVVLIIVAIVRIGMRCKGN